MPYRATFSNYVRVPITDSTAEHWCTREDDDYWRAYGLLLVEKQGPAGDWYGVRITPDHWPVDGA